MLRLEPLQVDAQGPQIRGRVRAEQEVGAARQGGEPRTVGFGARVERDALLAGVEREVEAPAIEEL